MTSFDAFDAHRMQMDNIDNNSQVEPPHSLAVATVNVKITEVVLPFSESETRPRAAVNPGRSLSLFLSHTQSRRQEMWSGFIGDASHALEGDVVESRKANKSQQRHFNMSGGEKKKESPAVTSYVNDFEGDFPCRLVTIVHDEMKQQQLDTQMTNGEAAAGEANDSPVSDAGKAWD
ncbi:hypothetical protein CCMA1212_005004 [Trichoderma ghanense]|uniref:Uncharacterized protein n=1 Tax=Trichoderma ghanense TaxID=65468 RepID=A0ABY2H5E8_9HYPO